MPAFPPGTQLGWHSLRAANLEGSGSLEGQHESVYGQAEANVGLSNQKPAAFPIAPCKEQPGLPGAATLERVGLGKELHRVYCLLLPHP